MIELHEVTEQEVVTEASENKGSELVIAFKAFLISEQAKKLPKNKLFDMSIMKLLNVKEAHYYALKQATSEVISRGKDKGKKRSEYDIELNKLASVSFPKKYKSENAKIIAFRFSMK
jgi:hypothetical protein